MPRAPAARRCPAKARAWDDGSVDHALLVKALGAFFAIMNPFVNLPIFLSLTAGQSVPQQRRTAVRTVMYSAVMCAVIAVGGHALLGLFGIGVDDFRVAGGLVLLTVALGMLSGHGAASHEGSKEEKDHAGQQASDGDVSFYPMTFPMIVGPGTITTLIVVSAEGRTASGRLAVGVALLLVLALLGVVLFFSSAIGRHMSMTLRTIMTRLMGMILASIAVGMLATGLVSLLPGLGR